MAMTEFQLIERFFSPLGLSNKALCVQGNGDDCAVIRLDPGQSLCFSIDTQVEGVHFPPGAAPAKLAQRTLAAAMSDLAAMGATPAFFTLALTLPSLNEQWLEQFSAGLQVLVHEYRFPLIGGDTTKGPLAISIQVHGLLEQKPLLRSAAREGDIVAVSGTLGDAGAALDLLQRDLGADAGLNPAECYLLNRYYAPTPRIRLGQALIGRAHACIDISDGLLAEAAHIAQASSLAIHLDSSALPLSSELVSIKGLDSARNLALSAGDDYELLFTLPSDKWQQLLDTEAEVMLTRIGTVQRGNSVFLDGVSMHNVTKGYQHFE